MQRRVRSAGRRRYVVVGLLAITIGLIWVVAAAADAPDGSDAKSTLNGGPVSPAIDPSHAVKVETCGSTNSSIPAAVCSATSNKAVKVTVAGGWVWYTHGNDCNTQRAGVGFAVDWFDPKDANADLSNGNSLSKSVVVNGVSRVIGVGVSSTTKNPYNPVDNVVHPTPNVNGVLSNFAATGTTGKGYGTAQDVDVTSPAYYKNWRGGCGTITTKQPKLPRGIWGPRANLYNGTATTAINESGLSHIYLNPDDISTICVVTYDVHAGTKPNATGAGGVGTPGGSGEITAGGSSRNIDNGVEKNGSTPLGNACPSIPVPQPSIRVSKDPKNQTVPLLGTAVFKITVTNNGNTDLTNVQITDGVSPNCAGALSTLQPNSNTTGWNGTTLSKNGTASYTCLSDAVPAVGLTNVVTACGDGGGATTCDTDTSTATTRTANVGIEDLGSNQDFVPNDTATLTGAINPAGNITFTLHAGSCTGTTLYTSGPLTYTAGVGSGNSLLLSALLAAQSLGPDTSGTYYWNVAYSGDVDAAGTQVNAPFSECTESFTIAN
jgi:uncharacterized repeat protein (TIGR01451 family)